MPTSVLEDWSGYLLSLKPPWTAQRQFTVTGTTAAVTALSAVGTPEGAPHPESADLVSEGPSVKEKKGTDFWVIVTTYKQKTIGGGGGGTGADTKYTWEPVEVCEQVDVDLSGRPILFSNGKPIQGGGSRPIAFKRLTVVRPEPFWDINKSKNFENGVNQDPVTLGGVLPIDAEHIRCVSIGPTSQYVAGQTPLDIGYLFEIILDDSLGKYPFQHRFLDADETGWYNDNGTKRDARFSNGKNAEPIGRVRLDGTGKPLTTVHPNVKVSDGHRSPEGPPQAVNFYTKEFYSNGELATGAGSADSTIIYFKRVRRVDLSLLGL